MGSTKKEKSSSKKIDSVEKASKKKTEKKDKKEKHNKSTDSKPIEREEKTEAKEKPKIEKNNDDNAQDDAAVTKKSKKRKAKKTLDEGQSKKKVATASPDKTSDPITYLRLFQSDRSAWKFNKMHQTWLLKHIYDADQIEDEDFKILIEYLKGLKGGARDRTLKDAHEKIPAKTTDYDQAVFDAEAALAFAAAPPPSTGSDDEDDENDTPEIKRARAIARALAC